MAYKNLIGLLCTVVHLTFVASKMHRIIVSNASARSAVCNDASDAIFYLEKTQSTKWIVFIESGGGCFDFDSCQERRHHEPYLFGSDLYPPAVTGEDVLSSRRDNLFFDYNKVIIPYCSSDMWLGNRTLTFQSSKGEKLSVMFRGSQICKSVMEDLQGHGLNNATELWLSGSSAGGIGAVNNARLLRDTYPFLKIVVLTDSSWFINYQNMLSNLGLGKFLSAISGGKLAACVDTKIGYPCCLSLFCLITNKYFPGDVHLFNIISRFDVYALTRGIALPGKLTNVDAEHKIVSDMLSFGGEIEHSVRQTKPFLNVHTIITSCFQHVYLAPSSLWSPGMLFYARSQTSFKLESFVFRHSVQKGRWNNVLVNGEAINKILEDWYETFVDGNSLIARNGSAGFKTPSSVLENSCRRIQCNPTCPKSVEFYSSRNSWPKWSQWLVLGCYLTFTLLCVLIKTLWTVKCKRESRLQNEFVSSLYDGANSLNAVGLPCCIPSNYIGLSCTGVQYTVSVAAHRRQVPSEPKLRWSHRLRCRLSDSKKEKRNILKGINAYFNPGQLVAIMGPSGSGKTTLLDILTGRKDSRESKVFINGLDTNDTREWFKRHSGYVLQLATPYYEELTVRENLTFSALMRLPRTMSIRNKLMRVEQVIGQTGLNDYADVVVGKSTGPGLSGGQKRRLCVAIQLLRVPSVLFLDEPTSGLDSASSLELLETLHGLTLSGRLVVLTIHQPRIEIFHMFDRILFLSNGHVAYYGSPIMAPTMIAEALKNSGEILDASNPADTIMDVLIFKKSQALIVEHYKDSGEIEAIQKAVRKATKNPVKTLSMKVKRYPSSLSDRLLSFDRRASKCQTRAQKLYLLIIFLLYGLALGSVYWQTENGILLMSCYQVLLCASQLFMASVIHAHFSKSMPVFSLEQAEGVGKSYELVIHAFVRIASLTVLPLLLCSAIIYLCTVTDLDLWKFFVTTIFHMQLNHVWISIIMLSACSVPRYSTLICPLLSAVSGFAGGFLVPEPEMPAFYYWLFYINPTHWAYSSTMNVLMDDVVFGCESQSRLECQKKVGTAILHQFGFDQVNPYRNMVIMIFLLILFLASTMAAVELRHTDKLKRWRRHFGKFWKENKRRFMEMYNGFKLPKQVDARKLIDDTDIEANGNCLKAHDASLREKSPYSLNEEVRGDIKKHNNLAGLNTEHLPMLLPVKVEPMLTGRVSQKNRPKTIAEFAISDSLMETQMKRTPVARSNTFTSTGRPIKYQHSTPTEPIGDGRIHTQPDIPKIFVENVRQNDDIESSEEERGRTDSEIDVCLSKYLDSTPKQHEVYSSVFGNRPKSTRRRSVTKRLPENVKRSESVHIQRKASMLILAERRKSMTAQLAGFGETFLYYNEVCNDKKPVARRHAALGVKRKVEVKKQRASDGSSRASVTSADLLQVPDSSRLDESVPPPPTRRSRLVSQFSIDVPDSNSQVEQHERKATNPDLIQFHVPEFRPENQALKNASQDKIQDNCGYEIAPRKASTGMSEQVKVSALKISRKKLVPLNEAPEVNAKYSDKFETESRSSLCRTPLGSIDEVEEDNDYFTPNRSRTRGVGVRKTSLQEAQQVHYFSENFSEITNWLRKNSNTFNEENELSDSGSTTKGSVVAINRTESVSPRDVARTAGDYLPTDVKDNDTDEEVFNAFHTKGGKSRDSGCTGDTRGFHVEGNNFIGSRNSFGLEQVSDKVTEKSNAVMSGKEVLDKGMGNGVAEQNSLCPAVTVSSPSPKTFSNALYRVSNNQPEIEAGKINLQNGNHQFDTLNCGHSIGSHNKELWETRSNEELFTEHERLLGSENTPSVTMMDACTNSKPAIIRRTSSCEFEFDGSETNFDNDIVRIRSLRRKSKKRKMESSDKSSLKSKEKSKPGTNELNETIL